MADGAILVATKNVLTDFDGRRVILRRGVTTVREGHPLLKGRESLFEPLVPEFELGKSEAKAPAQPRQSQGRPGTRQSRPAGQGSGSE